MAERWVGIVGSSSDVIIVDLEWGSPPILKSDQTWTLQSGSRPDAYAVLFDRCLQYARENGLRGVVVKASAVGQGAATLALLHSAEVRGVVQAAFAKAGVPVHLAAKAAVSRTFGKRKVDQYLKDETFWQEQNIIGDLRKGSRMSALLVIAHFDR